MSICIHSKTWKLYAKQNFNHLHKVCCKCHSCLCLVPFLNASERHLSVLFSLKIMITDIYITVTTKTLKTLHRLCYAINSQYQPQQIQTLPQQKHDQQHISLTPRSHKWNEEVHTCSFLSSYGDPCRLEHRLPYPDSGVLHVLLLSSLLYILKETNSLDCKRSYLRSYFK